MHGDELAGRVVAADQVSLVNRDVTSTAVEGRADQAVVELETGIGGGGLAGELLGLEGAGGVGDGLELLLRNERALVKRAVAVDLSLRRAELDFDPLQVGLGGTQ